MAYDDNLRIYAGVDQSGVNDGMNDMEENVRRGLDAVNSTAESKMGSFSGFFVAAANAAGQAIYKIADKAKDSFVSMLTAGDDYGIVVLSADVVKPFKPACDKLAELGISLGYAVLQGGYRLLGQNVCRDSFDILHREGFRAGVSRRKADAPRLAEAFKDFPYGGGLHVHEFVRYFIVHWWLLLYRFIDLN